MPNLVKLKKSAVSGKIPQSADLEYGELAINYADGLLYYKNNSNLIKPLNSTFTAIISNPVDGESITYNETTQVWENIYPKLSLDIQRCGFLNQTETTLFFNNTASPVTDNNVTVPAYSFKLGDVGAGWTYYINGRRYTITESKTVALDSINTPPLANTYYIAIRNNNTGTISSSTSVWSLSDPNIIPVAIIRFNNTLTPNYWLAEERHTILIDRRTHLYNHITKGTQVLLAGALSGYTVNTASDSATTFAISATSLADEDIIINSAALSDTNGTTNNYIIFYRTNATTWAWKESLVPFSYRAGSYIQYDLNGVLTIGINSRWYNTYLIFTNYSGLGRYILISGRNAFTSLALAQAEDVSAFDWTGLGIAEYAIAYQLTWSAATGNTNLGKVRLAAIPKRINISSSSASAISTASHNELTGLQGGEINQYYHLTSSQYTDVEGILAGTVAVPNADKLDNKDSSEFAILTTPTNAFTGTISHTGLVFTAGTNIDQITIITVSLTLTTDWQDTGIKNTLLTTGTYAVQLFANDEGAGGTNNNEYYSGIMSWYSGNTNSGVELPTDEIVLHRAGGSSDGELYLRTYRTSNLDTDELKLQIYSNIANTSVANYVFKFRRII